MIALIGSALQLVIMIFAAYLERSSAAAKAQQKYEVDLAEFQSLANIAMEKIKAAALVNSIQLGKTWDKEDQDQKEFLKK